MENLSYSTLAAAAGSLGGVIAWAGYFNHGEHHLVTGRYMLATLTFPLISFAVGQPVLSLLESGSGRSSTLSRHDVVSLAVRAEAAFIGSVWACMLIYRAFFHRLHAFPGPFSWKLTKFAQMIRNRNNENYKIVDQLHKKYGNYVRTGPTELSIVDPDAAGVILARAGRGPWYDGSWPMRSMLEMRNQSLHAQRRKVWDRGFGARALRDYEPRVDHFVQILAGRIADFRGEPVNVSKWFNYFSFDVMGDLAFARSFDMLHTGKQHHLLQLLGKGQQTVGYLGMAPWLFNFLFRFPGLAADNTRFVKYCGDLMNERKKMEVEKPDIAHWLITGQETQTSSQIDWLNGDSRLVVVAGSDTTAATLAYSFHHLCAAPEHTAKIQAELAALSDQDVRSNANEHGTRSFDARALQNQCPYLNAFITEALRLHPPVPGGFMRQTPPEGLTVVRDDGSTTVIPGEVNVWMPLWTLMRDERCFTHPLEFAPSRWLDADKDAAGQEIDRPRVLRKDAWLPFSNGSMGCVGKQLALQELRAVMATLLDRFTPRFAPGEDGHKLLYESLDWFTLGLGDLRVCFEERTK